MGPDIVAKLDRYEWGDSAFVIYVALDGPVEYKAGLVARHSAYVHPTPPTLGLFLTGLYRVPWREIAGSAARHPVQ